MATNPGYFGPTDGYIPSFDETTGLIDNFSRNHKDFPLMDYVTLQESKKVRGHYLRLSSKDGRRYTGDTPYRWNYDSPEPEPFGESPGTFVPYDIDRYVHGMRLGDVTKDQADFDVEAWKRADKAQQAMTGRVKRALGVILTAANWQTSAPYTVDMSAHHTGTATALAGGKLDVGTSTAPYLLKAFNAVEKLISADTGGKIKRKDLVCTMGPDDANLIGASAELHDYLKGSYEAKRQLDEGAHPNAAYGLPGVVYGMKIIVDDTRINTTLQDAATQTEAFAWTTGNVAIMARKGGIEAGPAGGPTKSTVTGFWYKDEFTYETFRDAKNRLLQARIVLTDTWHITSPNSGYLITSATA